MIHRTVTLLAALLLHLDCTALWHSGTNFPSPLIGEGQGEDELGTSCAGDPLPLAPSHKGREDGMGRLTKTT